MLGIALGAGDTVMSRTEESPAHRGLTFCVRADDKQRHDLGDQREVCAKTHIQWVLKQRVAGVASADQ